VLDVQHLQKTYGTQVVLRDVSFQVADGEKVGLIGRNGSGKTTVLNIVSGVTQTDSGTVICSRGLSIGYLSQGLLLTERVTVYEETLSVFAHLIDMEREIAELAEAISGSSKGSESQDTHDLARRLASLEERFESAGGYRFRSQTKAVLSGLGLGESRLTQHVSSLSGGEKARLSLAKLLLTEPDLLLLDEPTNHLDVSSVEWLESFLARYKGSVLLVSHDRYFLDRVVSKIVEIDRGVANSFPGNYTKYVQLKSELLSRQLKEWELQQREIERRQEIIDRFMQYGLNFHKKAKSKAKLLEKIERVEKPEIQDSMHVRVAGRRSGEQVLLAEGICKSFGARTVLRNAGLRLMRGDRVAVLGPNGSGKSTFLRILAGRMKPDSGSVRYGTGVELGYYDQEPRDLRPDRDVLTNFIDSTGMTPGEARNLLAAFLFRGDDVYKLASDLSGGERSRLRLAIVLARNPNLILLDEPTNHLDIPAIEALEAALSDFDGTLLFVTHDRYFVEKMAGRIIELVDGELVDYHGGYSYYLEKRASRVEPGAATDRRPIEETRDTKSADSPYEAQKALRSKRAELSRARERLVNAESAVSQQEREVEHLTEELSQPSVYGDPERSLETTERLSEAQRELERLIQEWESLYQELERLESEVQEMEERVRYLNECS